MAAWGWLEIDPAASAIYPVFPSHAGMDLRTLTCRAAGEYSEQRILDGRPVVALSWGFEATLQTRGCGKL
jgi:hypothetical protein